MNCVLTHMSYAYACVIICIICIINATCCIDDAMVNSDLEKVEKDCFNMNQCHLKHQRLYTVQKRGGGEGGNMTSIEG